MLKLKISVSIDQITPQKFGRLNSGKLKKWSFGDVIVSVNRPPGVILKKNLPCTKFELVAPHITILSSTIRTSRQIIKNCQMFAMSMILET